MAGLASSLALLLISSAALATDFYVQKGTGCRSSHPSCGVDEAGREFDDVDQCALALRPGDTCWIKNGTYTNGATSNDRGTYIPSRSGRPDARISFRAYPGHQPLFKSNAAWTLGTAGDSHYITWSDLRVDGVIRVQGEDEDDRVKGAIVENCDIFGGGGKNDGNWSGIFAQWTEDLVIRNNHIHDTEVDGSAKGISIFNGRRTLVEHNYIHGHSSEAVFDKEGGESNVFRRNIFESNGKHLKINNQRDERGVYNVGTEIYENLFLCDKGGGSTSILMLKRPTRWKVYSNTAFECQGIEVRSSSGPAAGEAVYNNIWWRSETRKTMWSSAVDDDREPAYMDHNLYAVDGKFRENRGSDDSITSYGLGSWSSREHPLRYDEHSLEGDPRFVDVEARNFRLAPDSPARGAGRNGEHLGAYPRDDSADIGPVGDVLRAAQPSASEAPPAAPAPAAESSSIAPCQPIRAETLFCDDFESGRLDPNAWRDVRVGRSPSASGPSLNVQMDVAASGRYAVEGRAVAGHDTDLWAARGFGDHPLWSRSSAADDIEIAAHVRFGPDFDFERGGAKLFIAGAFEHWQAGYASPNRWSPYYVLLQWRRAGKSPRPRELEGVLHRKVGCASSEGPCSQWRALPPNLESIPLEAGRWYSVRYRLKLNDPGLANGSFEAWLDGRPIIAYDDVDYRASYTQHGFNQLLLSRRAGRQSPTQSLYWDDVSVSIPTLSVAAAAPTARSDPGRASAP